MHACRDCSVWKASLWSRSHPCRTGTPEEEAVRRAASHNRGTTKGGLRASPNWNDEDSSQHRPAGEGMGGSSWHAATLAQNLISDSVDQVPNPTESSVMSLKADRSKSEGFSQIITDACISGCQPRALMNFAEKKLSLDGIKWTVVPCSGDVYDPPTHAYTPHGWYQTFTRWVNGVQGWPLTPYVSTTHLSLPEHVN